MATTKWALVIAGRGTVVIGSIDRRLIAVASRYFQDLWKGRIRNGFVHRSPYKAAEYGAKCHTQ